MSAPRTDRLVSIDALRGIAVLGILMMNVQGFAMTPFAYDNPTMQMDLTGANLDVWAFAHTFFAFKFVTLFSTLFGAGIVLMAGDGEDTGRHYPRMLWLLAIGAIHAYFLWWGDILVHYALLGMLAVLLRGLVFVLGALLPAAADGLPPSSDATLDRLLSHAGLIALLLSVPRSPQP